MKLSLIIISLTFLCLFSGCRNALNSGTSDKQGAQIQVKLDFEVKTLPNGKAKIVGTTNLPDNTNLAFEIKAKNTSYTGQDKKVVRAGGFESEEFSNRSNPLEKGDYTVSVTMPLALEQPNDVRRIIGAQGENLKGDLVKNDHMGATVQLTKEFQIK